MAEVRERIREKREKGIYGPDVEALLRVPLPGGRRILPDDLQDPLASPAQAGDEAVIRKQSEAFVELFAGRTRVLDLGCGRGTFLELLRDHQIGGYGVDLDPRMVGICRDKGLEAHEVEGLAHLRSIPASSIDG